MGQEHESVEWGDFEPFHIDNGQLDNVTQEQAFVLGVEWQMIVGLTESGYQFERPIHTENAHRVSQLLRRRCREFTISAYCEYDEWRWLRVTKRKED